MIKKVFFSIIALLLVFFIGFAIWYINEQGKVKTGNKSSFIPYNSALVINVNSETQGSASLEKLLIKNLENRKLNTLKVVTDSLRASGYVSDYPYVFASRVEGKSTISYLYVMDCSQVLARNDVQNFFIETYAAENHSFRKYDRYKIFTIKYKGLHLYYAVCGSIVLVSDSELYIEDALKQFALEEEESIPSRFADISKYLSADASFNVFMNTDLFKRLLPLSWGEKKTMSGVDFSQLFKWGTLDGELKSEGLSLNGFLQYAGNDKSFMTTISEQQAKDLKIDRVIPASLISMGLLNLSDLSSYLNSLDEFRYVMGKKENVYLRKQQYVEMFGRDREKALQNLLQGEFARIKLSFNSSTASCEEILIASVKSGSLSKNLLVQMLEHYAQLRNQDVADYCHYYNIDKEKSFAYYRMPAEDLPFLFWGELFDGFRSKYVLVEDNYIIFSNTENAMKSFLQDYVHRAFIEDVDWYKDLKSQLAGKYNLAYFARSAEMQPYYSNILKSSSKIQRKGTNISSIFPSFAVQCSNEGKVLYNSIFLNMMPIKANKRPYVMWQTHLDNKVSMKPVIVKNHITGEREIFVQDDGNIIYLVNDAGRILWKQKLEGCINSEVYQVDFYKNGKLQYLFSTANKIYLIDRNGQTVAPYPMELAETCRQGITLFDYDGNREYRIFVPCSDRNVYLYDLKGEKIKGWHPEKSDTPLVTPVRHFRIESKDYLVFADKYRLYILDRRGNERIKIDKVFDFCDDTDVRLVSKNNKYYMLLLGKEGMVNLISFEGVLDSYQLKKFPVKYSFNTADIDNDGTDECLFTHAEKLFIYDLDKKGITEYSLKAESLGMPYVYRFSAKDLRIGINDRKLGNMFLLTSAGLISQGFPICGDSPFSIAFSDNDGFYLYAGAENGYLLKYQVQY